MISREEFFKSEKLGKAIRPCQKIFIFGGLAASILVLVYSFIFMTPFADLYQLDGFFLFEKMKNFNLFESMYAGLQPKGLVNPFVYSLRNGNKVGMNLAYFTNFTRNELQGFNKWLFALGFFGIVASIVPLVYASQKRKIYYKTNLIVNPIVGTFNLYIGVHMLVQLIMNQVLVWSQDYHIINAYQTYIENNTATTVKIFFKKSDSTGIFVFGYIIAALVILIAIGTILLTKYKYEYQKRQPQIDISKVSIHE